MRLSRKKRGRLVCPKTGKRLEQKKWGWLIWVFPVTGLLALIWFLIRVIPKPSRATYPCQRVAMPLASGFLVWLAGLLGSIAAFRGAKQLLRRSRTVLACVCFLLAAVLGVISLMNMPEKQAVAVEYDSTPHGVMGVERGIYPGRVVWVHDPNATDWAGYESEEHWFESDHTDLAVVEEMLERTIRGVAGEGTVASAWDAIFRNFNNSRGKGDVGYAAGEKIAIKINLTTCNATGGNVDLDTYDKIRLVNNIDNSPQMILSLLRQLVYEAGVEANDITIGDPTCIVPNYMWDMLQPEFADVNYLDNYGGSGRTRVEFSEVPLYWSTEDAVGKPGNPILQDYLPISFAEADYMINFAILKGHSAGITVCAKNHYGSLIRTPDGNLWGDNLNYYDLHDSLPNADLGEPGMGLYRALVDLMGHPELGGKTVLYLIDGLFAGYWWNAVPYEWDMEPFGGDWPSSIFASQDGVAIDSVTYDFLLEEWPDVVSGGVGAPGSLEGGAEDYIHEAAMANDPCSGTFYDPEHDGDVARLESLGVHEHWNNATDKEYSRNLGGESGIELVSLRQRIDGDIDTDGDVDYRDFAKFAGEWMKSGCGECEGADFTGEGDVGLDDLRVLSENWLAGF